jgi:hypothetical protein
MSGRSMTSIWLALAREAGLSAEHIAMGATALGRANYAEEAYYAQAFFALSVGFERSCKLAFVVDHAIEHQGTFPSPSSVRGFGHDLHNLLARADRIAARLTPAAESERLPQTAIHHGIIETLAAFATNVTRYYNLDLVTGDPRVERRIDPIAAWSRNVTIPVLAKHYVPRYRQRHEAQARQVASLFGDRALVRFHAETGELIGTAYDASRRTGEAAFARRWERMYVLQIARFIGALLSNLGFAAQSHGLEDVPYLSDFFAIFQNDDAYLRGRSTWSIQRP